MGHTGTGPHNTSNAPMGIEVNMDAQSLREHRLDGIRKSSEQLDKIAKGFSRLVWMAEQGKASDAFLDLTEAAGRLTVASLGSLADLLEILTRAQAKTERKQ